jgi:aspartate 1-decarboxylase
MLLSVFKSKIHRATVTESNPDYEGSVAVDSRLMEAAGMLPYEQVHVWDVDNGARLTTYLLPGEPGSGVVCMNGAAALLVPAGHRVILATFASMEEKEARAYRPIVVLVDQKNRIVENNHREQPLRICR